MTIGTGDDPAWTGTGGTTLIGAMKKFVLGQMARSAANAATDRSGAIAAGGASQVLAAANANRKGVSVMNTSAGPIRISEIGDPATAAGAIPIAPGAEYLFTAEFGYVPLGDVRVWGATTGQAFVAREW